MSEPIVNLEGLQREAKNWQNVLRLLPYITMEEVLSKLRITTLEMTQKEDIAITFLRKRGVIRPYDGNINHNSEVGKPIESSLKLETAYCSMKDNILNYKDKKVLSNAGEKIDNQTKKHPLEKLILESAVKTWSEDVIDGLFPAKRDTSDQSPLGAFNGYDTIMDNLVTAGEISEVKKNLVSSGEIAEPTSESDVTALTRIIDWFKALNPSMRRGELIWYAPDGVVLNVLAALENKLKYTKDPDVNELAAYIQKKTLISRLTIITDPCLGSGDRFFVTRPGNLEFGMNSKGDNTFLQVRNPWEDPNLVQYYMQADFGTRILIWDQKEFCMNEGTPASLLLSGDYS